jgi:acyl-CoA synthetase (NDP forming)
LKLHPLDPLLRPRSIAVIGASERAGTVGSEIMLNLQRGGYEGALYPVNPGRDLVRGLPCHASLADLPETVEQVIFAVADARIEAALDESILHGARAATIYSSLVLENDSQPQLRERIREKILHSGMLLCGANGMGYYNFQDGIWASGFATRSNHVRGGNVTLISHSGSGMAGIIDCEERIDFNLVVSTGQELCVSMDQYMDYAIERMNTRVIGLFMETARDPAGLTAVLDKAAQRNIPVIALKVGRTELAARLTVSHSGAMAGQDEAYQALFDRYGVQRVEDMDELATALIMFAQPHKTGPGGLVSIHDSGGERQLMIDLADRIDVPLGKISAATETRLGELLDPGLEPVNPLDAWSQGGPEYHLVMHQCFAALMSDKQAAIGAVVHDRAPMGAICTSYLDYLRAGHAASGKPTFLVSNHQGTGADPQVVSMTREGFPVLDGLRPFLSGARCMFRYRDFQLRRAAEADADSVADGAYQAALTAWSQRLAGGHALDEYSSAQLLADFGIPVNPAHRAGDWESVRAAAAQLGYPVALKSARPGLLHKTDQGGVKLNLHSADELRTAYSGMALHLGPEVLVSRMLTGPGVEMMLGVVHDEQFGPLVLMGFGGIHVESLKDVVCALPPFNTMTAQRMVNGLRQRALFDGHRGAPAMDIDAFCAAAAQLSRLATMLGSHIAEIDINPMLVGSHGCVALDALVVGRHVADNKPHSNRRTQ